MDGHKKPTRRKPIPAKSINPAYSTARYVGDYRKGHHADHGDKGNNDDYSSAESENGEQVAEGDFVVVGFGFRIDHTTALL
jgi:hypothetical protein